MLLTPFMLALQTVAAVAIIALTVRWWKRRAYRKKMLSFCARDEKGNIYIRDPKTGAQHTLRSVINDRLGVSAPDLSPRQIRRARAQRKKAVKR